MTEKLLTSPLLTHSPTYPYPGDGANRSKFNFFSLTAPTQTNKDICTGTTCADSGFFVGGGGFKGGPGSSTYFTVYRGVQWFYDTFSRGVLMPISIETHITITCDFPGGGGVWTPYSPSATAHGQCGFLARIGSDEPVWPPFKLRNSQCQSVNSI